MEPNHTTARKLGKSFNTYELAHRLFRVNTMCTVKSFTLQPEQLILCTNLSSTARTTHPLHELVLYSQYNSSYARTCPLQPVQLILCASLSSTASTTHPLHELVLYSQYNSSSARACPLQPVQLILCTNFSSSARTCPLLCRLRNFSSAA